MALASRIFRLMKGICASPKRLNGQKTAHFSLFGMIWKTAGALVKLLVCRGSTAPFFLKKVNKFCV